MKIEDIIITLKTRLKIPVGRHLYGILGDYKSLYNFAKEIQGTYIFESQQFPSPYSVNKEIINAFNDDDFRNIVKDEAKRPEPTRASIKNVFETFIKDKLKTDKTLILKDLELIFIYNIDFSLLRVLATDYHRIILLLPGKKSLGRVIMYPESEHDFRLPKNLIADNHLWDVTD